MSHVVELSLNAEDFRLHLGHLDQPEHWLLRHPYGFGLLVENLRAERPDLGATRYRRQPELGPYLEQMVDVLSLREWPEPHTAGARVRATVLLLRMAWAFKRGSPLPPWRAA